MTSPPDEVVMRRLHNELEMTIRNVNRELIGGLTGTITRGAFANVAGMVANLRGRYLQGVLELSHASPKEPVDSAAVLKLKPMREAYTEAMQGFAALEHALERGYISLAD
jgi:hypothetical protein